MRPIHYRLFDDIEFLYLNCLIFWGDQVYEACQSELKVPLHFSILKILVSHWIAEKLLLKKMYCRGCYREYFPDTDRDISYVTLTASVGLYSEDPDANTEVWPCRRSTICLHSLFHVNNTTSTSIIIVKHFNMYSQLQVHYPYWLYFVSQIKLNCIKYICIVLLSVSFFSLSNNRSIAIVGGQT